MSNKHIVIPVFVPHKGCPFDCIYCNQRKISGQLTDLSEEEIRGIIESHLSSAGDNAIIEIGFYGGSFTGIDKELQIRYLTIANDYIKKNLVGSIRLSTRPDYINEEILDYLKYFNVSTIELGVQSLDDGVLSSSCRGHSVNDVITSVRLIREWGINLGIQTMIGLPGDTWDKALKTAQEVIDLKPEIVRIYPTLVIRDTYLETLYKQGKYIPLTLEQAVDLSAVLLQMYNSHEIQVIRIGLQATENINQNSDVVAGPFHPAFRQLVESKLMLNRVEEIIQSNHLESSGNIFIYTGPRNLSNVIGQKKRNICHLKSKYGYNSIKMKIDTALDREIRIEPYGK